MLWIKAFHIIFMVCWFAGLFYLPRLFIYHAQTSDEISIQRFKIMEKRLYYAIMWPAGILTAFFGLWLMSFSFHAYLQSGWMHAKLGCIIILWGFHLYCGHCLKQFQNNANPHTEKFYRIFNEIPSVLLIVIIILAVVKPF